jgi:hypothetical protein
LEERLEVREALQEEELMVVRVAVGHRAQTSQQTADHDPQASLRHQNSQLKL